MTDRGVAIVTGGGCGIGLAIAKALLSDGWRLATADLAPGPLDAARTQSEPVRAKGANVVVDVRRGQRHNGPSRLRGRFRAGPRPGQSIGQGRAAVSCSSRLASTGAPKAFDICRAETFMLARKAGKLMRADGGAIGNERGNGGS
jgi:NAD(P)-dependent dehydrogenase (short-subunit alcohol dehydrogenase family)